MRNIRKSRLKTEIQKESEDMRGIVDIHAHVLPGVDDGARNMDEALFLLCSAVSQGITAVFATSHNSGRADPKRLKELAMQTEQEARRKYPEFRLYLGQEIYFHEEILDHLKEGKLLTMADSRYVLVEFSTEVTYGSLYRGIRALTSGGYWPVLAHMERYDCLRREEHLLDLINSGCLLQMNYESLQGSAVRREVRWCRSQVLSGRIHFLGTDMHRKDFRPPDISGSLEWLEKNVEEELLNEMVWENPLHIINKEGIL